MVMVYGADSVDVEIKIMSVYLVEVRKILR